MGDAVNSAICQLIKGAGRESIQSLSAFIAKVDDLDRQMRDDLVCARLFGERTFLSIALSPLWRAEYSHKLRGDAVIVEGAGLSGLYYLGQSFYAYESGKNTVRTYSILDRPYMLWDIEFNDPNFARIVENHAQLLRLKEKEHSGGEFIVSFQGYVERMDFEYEGVYSSRGKLEWKTLTAVRITVRNARVNQIATSTGQGTSSEVLKSSALALKRAYDKYMN